MAAQLASTFSASADAEPGSAVKGIPLALAVAICLLVRRRSRLGAGPPSGLPA